MGLLDRFFGNDLKLTRPDFNRFEHIELDFSGTKLRFKDAAHSAMYPIDVWPEDIDIYNPDSLNSESDGSYGKRFYVRGWDFLGEKNKARGGCSIDSLLFYFPEKYPEPISCFSKNILEQEVLEYCHDVWGWKNPGSSLGSLGSEGNTVYPVNPSELSFVEINKTTWCRFTSQWKGNPPEILYACPLSKNHILINSFTTSAYGGVDFYSPETNLEQTCYDVINDYMSEFYIELSERSKQERAQAKGPI